MSLFGNNNASSAGSGLLGSAWNGVRSLTGTAWKVGKAYLMVLGASTLAGKVLSDKQSSNEITVGTKDAKTAKSQRSANDIGTQTTNANSNDYQME